MFLHGQPSTHVTWLPARRLLPEVDVLMPDRPGYGANPARPSDYPGNVEWLLRMLDDAGIERAVLAGHSWGGGIGLLAAARHPDRVAGLLLVASVGPRCLLWQDHPLAWPVLGDVLAFTALRLGSPIVRWQTYRELRRRVARPDLGEVAESLRSQFDRPVWRSFVREQRALLRQLPALNATLSEIDTPTIVLAGSSDSTIPPVTPRLLSTGIAGAQLRVVPGVGHILPLDAPSVVARSVLDLLARAGAARPA